jgi:hypothetical protein
MMAEEKPGFTVVDRRQSSQQESSGTPAPPAAGAGEPDNQAGPSETPMTDDDGIGFGPELSEEGERTLPAPSFLLSMASLQMTTREMMQALLAIFDEQAWRSLGLMASPLTGETNTDLPAAQCAIDCVQFFLGKLESGLPDTERREAQRRLTDLRMNYVSRVREG